MLKLLGTAIVTAILVSAFWIFYYGITNAPRSAGTRDVAAPGELPDVHAHVLSAAENGYARCAVDG